jgi:hypothetical protein
MFLTTHRTTRYHIPEEVYMTCSFCVRGVTFKQSKYISVRASSTADQCLCDKFSADHHRPHTKFRFGTETFGYTDITLARTSYALRTKSEQKCFLLPSMTYPIILIRITAHTFNETDSVSAFLTHQRDLCHSLRNKPAGTFTHSVMLTNYLLPVIWAAPGVYLSMQT